MAAMSNTPVVAVILFGGLPLLIAPGGKCLAKEFDSDLLAGSQSQFRLRS